MAFFKDMNTTERRTFWGCFAALSYGLFFVAAFILPETRGTELMLEAPPV
tara:strand:- start:616 stop:765 length:150 start_codon:yes stop_codon:yes gene_type:complete